jgi:hypothetical protein
MDGAPEAAQESLGAGLSAAQRLADPALAETAQNAFVSGMHTTALVAAAVVALGAVVSALFLPSRAAAPEAHGMALAPEPAVA